MVDVNELEEIGFRAMGSSCRIVTRGSKGASSLGAEMVHDLERKWSRFIPSSEVHQLNGQSGHLVVMSMESYQLVSRAEQAREWTQGRFNPLMLSHIETLGYDKCWPLTRQTQVGGTAVSPSVEPIELYPSLRAVIIPSGTRFDPGGIGKGLAADMVCDHLESAGATTVMIDLGGDLRVSGRPWHDTTWRVDIAAPQKRTESAGSLTLDGEGAIATSSVLGRRWRRNGQVVHHLIDPNTGRPSDTDLLTVSVTAPTAWRAEVAAKSALLVGAGGVEAELHRLGVHGVAFTRAGNPISSVAMQEVQTPWN